MTRRILVVAVAVLFSWSTPAVAQDELTDLLWVLEVHAVPGKQGQFENYVRKIIEGAETIGDQTGTLGYQTLLGGKINRYFFARPFDTLGQMDDWRSVPQILIEAFGQEEAGRIQLAGGESIESAETTVYATQHDMSSATPGVAPGAFAHVVRTVIDPEKFEPYMGFLAALSAAEKSLGVEVFRRSAQDGPALEFTAVQFFNSHAERDTAPDRFQAMQDIVGENQARALFRAQREAIAERETLLLQARPDLTRIPGN
jgi:hypothetical protein